MLIARPTIMAKKAPTKNRNKIYVKYLHSYSLGENFCNKDSVKITCYEAGVKIMLGKGEHGHPDVAEDKVFGHEIKQAEKLLGDNARLFRQIVVGVVSLTNTTRKNGDDPRQVQRFCHQKCRVGHQYKKSGF